MKFSTFQKDSQSLGENSAYIEDLPTYEDAMNLSIPKSEPPRYSPVQDEKIKSA